MERWRKRHPATDETRPLALASEGAHGIILDAVNVAARDEGAKPGQRLTDARATCPELGIEFSDRAGDARHLARLGHWAQRWSPWTAVDGADGLLLDCTGAAHCFGGEQAMWEAIGEAFAALGFAVRLAFAPTIGAAWALARFGASNRIGVEKQMLPAALAPLPVESLRIDPATALLLRRLGLKTVGTFRDIPTPALARRFRRRRGELANPLRRLRQAYGEAEEVTAPLTPLPVYRAARRVAEPVQHVAVLQPILADLAEQLCRDLAAGQRGLRRVRFEAFRIDGHVAQLEVETAAPVRSPEHIAGLFAERIEKLDAGFGFDAFALTALWHETMEARQQGLEEDEMKGIALPHLLDRLRMRLGADNVSLPAPYPSHLPERSLVWHGGQDAVRSLAAPPGPERERPIRLFDRPEPVTVIYATPDGPPRRFRWRRRLHDVAKVQGPERIAPEWWRERSHVRLRDYYKVEDREGRRFWICRNGVADDGRGGPPQWFVHGLFF